MTENKTVNSNSKEIINSVMFGESCDINLSEGVRLICVTAESKVTGVEVMNNELRVGVKTVFHAVCQTPEGEFEVKEVSAENVRSIVKEGVSPSGKAVINACVTDCEFTAASNGKATATVEINGWFLKENTLSFLNNDVEGVYCRTEAVTVENIALLKESGLTLTHSNEARMPLKKIIDCVNSVCINNVYPSSGVFQIEGELTTRIAAITDNNQFLCQSFNHPFSTEVGEEICRADSVIDVDATVVKSEITLTDGDARIFITDTEITFRAAITERIELEGVADCYSVTNEINATTAATVLDRCFCYRTVRDKASSVVKPGGVVNEVHCVLSPIVSSVSVTNINGLTAEGLILATVLYADENNVCSSATAEIPFMTDISKDYECDTHLHPTVAVTNITARLRTSSEIEVSVEFAVTVRGVSEQEITLVSAVEIGAEKEDNDYAISLYIVKPGETLWDVAKALNTDTDTIIRLNEEIKTPLKGGEKILVYKELSFSV